jgi:hypothetical protein
MPGPMEQGTLTTGSVPITAAQLNGGDVLCVPTGMTAMRLTLTGLDGSNTVKTQKRTTPGGTFVDQTTYNSNQSSVSVPVAMSNQAYPSAVRAATFVGDDNRKVPGNRGVKAVLDVTAVPGVDTVQLVIENRDPASGKYVQVLAAAARVAAGTDTLTVYPGGAVTANVSANDIMADTYRARVVHSAASNFTYSLSLTELS